MNLSDEEKLFLNMRLLGFTPDVAPFGDDIPHTSTISYLGAATGTADEVIKEFLTKYPHWKVLGELTEDGTNFLRFQAVCKNCGSTDFEETGVYTSGVSNHGHDGSYSRATEPEYRCVHCKTEFD